jgi:hypothetical protein
MAENRRAFWQEETKVVTSSLYLKPMYKNHLSITHLFHTRFFSIYLLPVFLTPFLEGRSCRNYYTDIVKNLPFPLSQIGKELSNLQ